ncbi:hypothetical protein F5Y19DRAFT_483593 [Xylariaceae sp. FL1651]|nr:hypothetical protein F5Y19DRAFT_483593 [Xylariaceae sp. FL1651]
MPKPDVLIAAPLRVALIECYRAATRLATEDVDVVAPPSVLTDFWEAIQAGAPNFSLESDGKIAFDTPQGFRVRIDMIEIGSGCIERIHETVPFYEGAVTSMSDLLRLRAVTVVDRGSDGDRQDFRWLLSRVAEAGQILPKLNHQELKDVLGTEECLGRLDRLVLIAIIGPNNVAAALRLLSTWGNTNF